MGARCVLLYGDTENEVSKYAGTFRIATELRIKGYSTQCIDITAFDGFDQELADILSRIIDSDTLWVGISTTFLHSVFGLPSTSSREYVEDSRFRSKESISVYTEVVDFIDFVKALNPMIKFIAGGHRRFSLGVLGFKTFEYYSDKEIIEFTQWCEGTNKNVNLEFFSSRIQGSEYANFHTSQILFEKQDIIEPQDPLPIEISRGCIFKCKFCAYPLNGKKKGEWIKHTSILLDEFLRNYEMHGTVHYSFGDDTYNDSEEKVKRLYDEVYSKLPFKIKFAAFIRLDLLHRFKDTAEYLKESGLKSAMFGIETINHESGKAIGKGMDPRIQFEFIEELKKQEFKDVLTVSGFIMGLPKDREDEMDRLEEFLFSDKNKLDSCKIFPLAILHPSFRRQENKSSYSEFELEHEKYGYEHVENDVEYIHPLMRWRNRFTGMTYDKAEEYADRVNIKIQNSKKFKFGEYKPGWLRSLGVNDHDLLTLSFYEMKQKYNIEQLIENKKQKYRTALLKIVNEEY